MNEAKITMEHGAGGRLSQELMRDIILPKLGNDLLYEMHDGAVFSLNGRAAFTTDSYVVKPLFFPGGSIGKLAVCGTVNDLAMAGARAKYLSLSLIMAEGLSFSTLKKIVDDIASAAKEANVKIVTGDTKVVAHDAADEIFINTAGVGEVFPRANFSPRNVRPGMDIIVSGTLGDHAATILAARHKLTLPEGIMSDCAPLVSLVEAMTLSSEKIAVMRDATRGGVAAVLNELAAQSGTGMIIEEELVPVKDEVRGVCDILGLDVLNLANEGKLVAILPGEETEKVLTAMKKTKCGENAAKIGTVTSGKSVAVKTKLGSTRLLELPEGDPVPRIC